MNLARTLAKLTGYALILVATVTIAYGADIRLAWDANEEPAVIGYNVYFKNHINEDYKGMYEIREQDFDNPLFPSIGIWGLSETLTYYFVATAFSEEIESGHSNEVIWTYKAPEPDPTPVPDDNSDGGGSGGGGGCFINTLTGG